MSQRRIDVPEKVLKSGEPRKPSDWFVTEQGADNVARRRHVFGLLGWYHTTVVQPNLGIRGVLRRFWLRITGRSSLLLSPWELLAAKLQEQAELERAELEERHRNGS